MDRPVSFNIFSNICDAVKYTIFVSGSVTIPNNQIILSRYVYVCKDFKFASETVTFVKR